MNARFSVSAALLCGALLWSVTASSGAPEAVDVNEGFGEAEAAASGGPATDSSGSQGRPVIEPISAAATTDTAAAEPGTQTPPADLPPALPAVEISPFKAVYDVKMKGIVVGELEVSLAKVENGEWVYRQKSSAKGVAALFGPEDLVETSRFRRVGDGLQVLEYRSKREDGDADDNARFVFDHAAQSVNSVGKGTPWSVKAPKGTVDPLLMTLAMRFDLAKGKVGETGSTTGSAAPTYLYNVPRQGRIKVYEFGVAGVENLQVTGRSVSTVHVKRLRDKNDQTSIWTAPEMDYLPVRILKTRKEGSSSEVILRSFVRS